MKTILTALFIIMGIAVVDLNAMPMSAKIPKNTCGKPLHVCKIPKNTC